MSSIITSPEFFVNMKSTPTPDSREFSAFVQSELKKLEEGVTINGTYFSNWLYWHLNYWKIYRPGWDERRKEVIDIFDRPLLRDNEWIIAENLQAAKEKQKGLWIVGSRRISKTTFVASWLALGATIYEGSQNVIVGNNKPDIRNITPQMSKGLGAVDSFLRYNKIRENWQTEVALGAKIKDGGIWREEEWSQIHIRNTEEGTKTEALAGLTPKTLVFDETGKAPCKEVLLASIPSYNSPYGWRCIPIGTGTGGDMKSGSECKEIFEDPDRFNMLAIEIDGEKRKTGLFIDGTLSIDVPKIEMSLSDYLEVSKGSELDTIKIHIADRERGLEIITTNRELLLKSGDNVNYLKAVMYAPLNPDECFMDSEEDNPFPVEALKTHLEFLKRSDTKISVKLFRDGDNKVCYLEDNKRLEIKDFPVTKDTLKDAPVIMYEEPKEVGNQFLYISGIDPYNQNKSMKSPSLGTCYIYKRTYDPVAGTFQNRIVASYAARPENMKDWHQTVEMLLELYGATAMIENEGTNFIQYLENKNKIHYLADGYNLAREINPKTSIQGRVKGLPATVKIQEHYKNLVIEYCKEEVMMTQDQMAMGLIRITDEMLVVELINYRPKQNADRLVAFGHTLVYDEYLQKIAPIIRLRQSDAPVENTRKSPRNPFGVLTRQEGPAQKNPFAL